MSNFPIYIFGHRNPDADSICSAIAYADFKNRSAEGVFLPARCGNSNDRIESILHHFNQPLPLFIGDITPRIRDIMNREVIKINAEATCHEALRLIDEHDIRALPVVDDNNTVTGLVSIFQLGEFFIPKLKEPKEMRLVHTSVNHIVRALGAKVLFSRDEQSLEELYVRVGAMDVRSFGKFSETEDIDPSRSIIVVGDRWDIQQRSIQYGVRLLVITGDLNVDPEVLAEARARGVSLIISRYDSATTAWIIRSASCLEKLISRQITCFRPEENLDDIRRKTSNINQLAFMVTDENGQLLGVFSRTDLLRPIPTRIILVDHNELSQAVPGAKDVEILEIVDHHRLGNLHTAAPILFINEPVGSTCTIVADLYRREGLVPDRNIAGIMMGGIISDTLLLKSPTTTEKDRRILAWLEEVSGQNARQLADIIFASGSIILSQTPAGVIRSDCKTYHEENRTFSVSQVEELGFGNFWDHADQLIEALKEMRQRERLHFSALMITDINTQNSLLAVVGELGFIELIKYPVVNRANVFELPGVVSRKKQLLPFLTGLLQSLPSPVSLDEEGK